MTDPEARAFIKRLVARDARIMAALLRLRRQGIVYQQVADAMEKLMRLRR